MLETQQTISEWAEATFGPASSHTRVAARANEELAELLRCLAVDERSPKAGEEVADVCIVLCRLATRLGGTLDFLPDATLMHTEKPLMWAVWAHERMGRLLRWLAADDLPSALCSLQGCVCMLCSLDRHLGLDVRAEMGRKMAVNRQRVWKRDGSGHGYHVRDKESC